MKTQNQKDIAAFLGISPQYLSDIKRKRRTLGKKTAIRISEKTGLNFQEILFLTGDAFLKKARIAMIASSMEGKK